MRWNHFERDDPGLARFLVVGDAAWAYNPLYGQGMSIGVTCARILRDVLRERPDLDGLPRRYYPRAHRFAFPPWEATALMDMRWPKTVGKRPWHAKITLPVSDFIVCAGQCDETVSKAMLDGIHLLKQPYELLTPGVLLGVAKYGLRRLTSRLPPPKLDLPMADHA